MKKKRTNIIKCAYCDWTAMRFRTNKKGKVKSGYAKLISHVMMHHPDEYEKVQHKLSAEAYLRDEKKTDT